MRQTFLKKIVSGNLAASTDYVAPGNLLPLKTADGRIIYHRGWLVEMDATLSFTAQPGEVGHNNLIKRAQWGTGNQLRYALTGNGIRAFEVLEGGKHAQMEAVQTASTHPRFVSFFVPNGPFTSPDPDAYDLCCANLQDSEFRVTSGALLDVSSDCTAMSGTVRIWAVLSLSDDTIDAGVFYERREEAVASGTVLQGQCLLASVGLAEAAYAGISAGDFSSLTIETGSWNIVDSVDASTMARLFNYQNRPGQLDAIAGEPRDGTYDVNQRTVNLASPTAIAAQSANLQPVLLWHPQMHMDGLLGRVPANFNVKWSGTAGATSIRLVSRFLPVTNDKAAEHQANAARVLGKTVVRTTSAVKSVAGVTPKATAMFATRTIKTLGR